MKSLLVIIVLVVSLFASEYRVNMEESSMIADDIEVTAKIVAYRK